MTPREEFRAYMKAANRTSDNDNDRHLSEAQVVAYCRGELSGEEYDASQAHLTGCQQCIALFRNVRDFIEHARPDEAEITAAETQEAWQSFLDRVQTPAAAAVGAGSSLVRDEFPRRRARKSLWDARATLALAASLLISLSAFGWLTWRYRQEQQSRRQSEGIAAQLESRQRELEQRLSQLEQSGGDQLKRELEQRLAAEAQRDQLKDQLAAVQQNWQNIPVYSRTLSSERGETNDLHLQFGAASGAALLRLFRSRPFEFSEYGIQIFDAHEKMVQEFAGLRPSADDGALSVLVNSATLNAGKYKLRLVGHSGKTKQALGDFELSVTIGR